MLFLKANRADYSAKYPKKGFGDLSRKIAEDWKKITPEKKKIYEDEHEREKEKYKKLMENYKPPTPETSDSDSEEKKKKPRKRAKKDPNAPKKPINAYMFYTKARREGLKKQYPDLKITEISKKLGEEWKEMDKDERAPYEAQSQKDKERYKLANDEYNENKS